MDQQPAEQAQPVDLEQVLYDAASEFVDGMVLKVCIVVEYVTDDGKRAVWSTRTDTTAPWDAVALHTLAAGWASDSMRGESDDD